MNIYPRYSTNNERLEISFQHYLLLAFLVWIPLSCSAQKNILTGISSSQRNDNKGHVIRFHLREKISSFHFSQPKAYLLQLELHGKNLNTSHITLNDQSQIIKNVVYYSIHDGIGVDLILKQPGFYKAAAYHDRASEDLLLGLTKTAENELLKYTAKMHNFAWSKTPLDSVSIIKNKLQTQPVSIDTTYQKIKNNIKFDTVVLDPGHGGHDVGAIGYHHTYEKNVVLAIAKKVGGYIKENLPGVKVVYTRDSDKFIELKERGRIANRADGDLFVSIHCNSARARQASGTETYFLGLERSKTALQVMQRENNIVGPGDTDSGKKLSQEDLIIYELANSGYIASSERLAAMIQKQFKTRANRRSRGVKQARFVVLYHASMPAILIETGFITNPAEQQFLTSDYGQSIIASAIFRAIRNYKVEFDKSQHLTTN